MNADEIFFLWYVWLGVAGIIVLAAALLLIAILVLAHRIRTLAAAALGLVEEIEHNTKPIWQLNTTRRTATELLQGANEIERNSHAIAETLSVPSRDHAA